MVLGPLLPEVMGAARGAVAAADSRMVDGRDHVFPARGGVPAVWERPGGRGASGGWPVPWFWEPWRGVGERRGCWYVACWGSRAASSPGWSRQCRVAGWKLRSCRRWNRIHCRVRLHQCHPHRFAAIHADFGCRSRLRGPAPPGSGAGIGGNRDHGAADGPLYGWGPRESCTGGKLPRGQEQRDL